MNNIKRKLKKCRLCNEDKYLFSRGRCLECTKKEEKYKIPKQSKKEKDRLEIYYQLREKYLNKHPNCEICNAKATEIHHKGLRTGDNLFKHFMSICRACHLYLHEHPEESYEKGYLLVKI